MDKPILVLCIDRDNDLYEKAKLHGPIIGREENIKAATKLALADPEDPDANAIFSAVRIHDELKKDEEKNVVVATITGHKRLGHVADREIARQIDKILDETHAESCIFVSDGASDEEIIPIIKSRLKIDSSKVVVMKQAKELEKTYFVILEKLKDPYYAKIIIGIPAMILLLLSLASNFGYGWQPVGIAIGLMLILWGFGIYDSMVQAAAEFRFSIDKTSWIAYISSLALLTVAAVVMYQAYWEAVAKSLQGEKVFAYTLRSGLFVVPWALLFIIVGKSLDARAEKRKFAITRYALLGSAIMLTTMLLVVGSNWILNLQPPYVSFSDFLFTILVSIGAGYATMQIIRIIREETLADMKLEGKEAIGESGTYLGKVVGVNMKEGYIIVQTPFERRMSIAVDDITSVSEKVVVKT